MCMASLESRFIELGTPRRIWSVSAIHSEAERLIVLHDELYGMIEPGDRIVYHGNYSGYGAAAVETIDEILTFRRMVLSIPGMKPSDIIYLRGSQEEMWQKLLQLQFAPNPSDVLLWMLGNGMSSSLEAYGISPHDGIIAAQEGVMALTRWTGRIREAIRRRPGHDVFSTQLRPAAFTDAQTGFPMLFVHGGINPETSLESQGDSFWWPHNDFNAIHLPYAPFSKVVRGFDPRHRGLHLNCVTATIDGGCGFGGALVCAGFAPEGDVVELLEA